MKTDGFGKDGGKRASAFGRATNTRSDARFPPGFVEEVRSHRIDYTDESFWGAVKRRQAQLHNS